MSQGFDSARAQVMIELGLQGEGVIDTAAEQMRQLREAMVAVSDQNKRGILVGNDYLEVMRKIISVMNQLTKSVNDVTVAERAHAAENLKYQQDLAKNAEKMLAGQIAADQKVAQERVKIEKQFQSEVAQLIAKARTDKAKSDAELKAGDADMAKVRAALLAKEVKDAADANAEMTRSWQDRIDKQAALDQQDVDHAKEILAQRQVAVKLDAEVNSVIMAGAKAEHADLTRTIELQVNPRMAASDKYRQSLDDAVKATQRAKQAEDELTQSIEKHRAAKASAEAFADIVANGGDSKYYPQADYIDLLQKQTDAESDLVGAQIKHAAAQGQVTTATTAAATAQKAMQSGTQAGTDKMMAWTRTVYFAAQGLEDLQYGFNAVVNNIPMVAMSVAQGLGATSSAAMAWAGGISLIAVGINSVLIPAFKNFVATHEPVKVFFDDLDKSLNPFHVDVYASALERMNDRIKELTDKKIKVAIDSAELIRLTDEVKALQKATEAANAILHHQTAREAQMGKNIATDLETEEGRKQFDLAREASANKAVEQSRDVQAKQVEVRKVEKRVRELEAALADPNTNAIDRMNVNAILPGNRRDLERVRDEMKVVKEGVKIRERGRFDLDYNAARSDVGSDQAAGQGRFLNNLRAAGQGALADKIEGDISNAQSGLGTQAEIEGQANVNKSAMRKKLSKESQTDHEQLVNKFAGLYKTKEQSAIDKIVASAIIGQRAEDVVRAEVQSMLEQKMLIAGIDPVVAKQAAAQTMASAIDTSKANVMAAGDTPEAGSAAILEKLNKPAAAVAAKIDRQQSANQNAANSDATAQQRKFGKPSDNLVQEFLAANQAEQEIQNRLSRTKQGRAELATRRANQKREGAARRQEVSAYNKSAAGKAYIASLSPEERAAELTAQNIYKQTSPFAGTQKDPQAGAKEFITPFVENSLQVGGMPGADDPLYRNAQASKVVEQSQQSLNTMIAGNFNQVGNMLQATIGAQQQLNGQMARFQARMSRMSGMANGVFAQVNDLRQSGANAVD